MNLLKKITAAILNLCMLATSLQIPWAALDLAFYSSPIAEATFTQNDSGSYIHDAEMAYFGVSFENALGFDVIDNDGIFDQNVVHDSVSQVMKLTSAPGSGFFTTGTIIPTSFVGWHEIAVAGTFPTGSGVTLFTCDIEDITDRWIFEAVEI